MKRQLIILLFVALFYPLSTFAQTKIQKEEYIEITFFRSMKGWKVLLDDGTTVTEKPIETTTMNYLNKKAEEGWVILNAYTSPVNGTATYFVYTMKREKQ